jgi:hypothetical protein
MNAQNLTIKEEVFLDWYFNNGYDQCQEQTVKDLGREVRDELINNGTYTVNAQDIFDYVNQGVIPIRLVESDGSVWISQPEDGELDELNFEYKLYLIKN